MLQHYSNLYMMYLQYTFKIALEVQKIDERCFLLCCINTQILIQYFFYCIYFIFILLFTLNVGTYMNVTIYVTVYVCVYLYVSIMLICKATASE